jgi:hypothetical protein
MGSLLPPAIVHRNNSRNSGAVNQDRHPNESSIPHLGRFQPEIRTVLFVYVEDRMGCAGHDVLEPRDKLGERVHPMGCSSHRVLAADAHQELDPACLAPEEPGTEVVRRSSHRCFVQRYAKALDGFPDRRPSVWAAILDFIQPVNQVPADAGEWVKGSFACIAPLEAEGAAGKVAASLLQREAAVAGFALGGPACR